ncbi:hypothetical protein QQF21_17130 [Lelliottia sp. V89_10]|uniref:hypothetical protein n=1 Tax=Lelliottia wanjuensis TaxID=3050585 RepID=UPI00249EA51D|nr:MULTISPECIES: hypothetical protein [unclassified Lelliottia]MDI3359756.1 hypothetical protein [Lelliottia sp. V89_13]MDK9548714.1 hypothetical protein [Lelliottia sp. V89_5]MDK9597346.1 hypothetical protein [Lelliottia sp. V89_10]
MKLNDFAGALIADGLVVLNVSGGVIVDYLAVPAAERTLINRSGDKLAARRLDTSERITTIKILTSALKSAAELKSDL